MAISYITQQLLQLQQTICDKEFSCVIQIHQDDVLNFFQTNLSRECDLDKLLPLEGLLSLRLDRSSPCSAESLSGSCCSSVFLCDLDGF